MFKKLSCRREAARCFWLFEYFAKSFKVTQSHSKRHSWVGQLCKSILVFPCNYVSISYRFWDIQRQIMVWPWNVGYGSFNVIEDGAATRQLGTVSYSNSGRIFGRFDTTHERDGRQTDTTRRTTLVHCISRQHHIPTSWTCSLILKKRSNSVGMLEFWHFAMTRCINFLLFLCAL